MAQSPCSFIPLADSPCWFPFAPFLNPLYLLGNPPCCDRIRPPWSQVTCKLTSPSSTLSHPSPLQIPSTQVNYAPHYDDLKNPASLVRNNKVIMKGWGCSGQPWWGIWWLFSKANLLGSVAVQKKEEWTSQHVIYSPILADIIEQDG